MPPTIAEREAELAALQSAFDEYITSSRELEEELDAELAKMRKYYCTATTTVPCRQYCCHWHSTSSSSVVVDQPIHIALIQSIDSLTD